MKAKEYLKQYRRALERVTQYDQLIERLYLQAEVQATAPKDALVKGSGKLKDPTADVAVKIAEVTARLNDQRVEALQLLDEIEKVIAAVPDPVHSRILFDRYIAGMDWYAIADEIGYDPAHTRGRLHGSALLEVQEILENLK